MSGSCGTSSISSGVLSNNGLELLTINNYLNLQIKDIIIHIIPLSIKSPMTVLRTASGILKQFIPCLYYPSLTHIAIQINLENCEDVLFIEYGEYFSEKTEILNESKKKNFSSSGSSKQPKPRFDENLYYYINNDGVRLTVITKDTIQKLINKKAQSFPFLDAIQREYIGDNYIHYIISEIIANQLYGEENIHDNGLNEFFRVECNIENNVNLNQFIENFKGEKWLAKKYNVVFHNCQDFGCEVIKILKATRKYEIDRIRLREKVILPNCIVNALISNEGLTKKNICGRIPIFGFFHDQYQLNKKDY